MMMKTVSRILRDISVALLLGLSIGIIFGMLLWVVGMLLGGIHVAFTFMRSGLLLASGFCLIFSAGLLLKGEKLPKYAFKLKIKEDSIIDNEDCTVPRRTIGIFKKLKTKYAVIFIAVGFIVAAAVADYILWMM